MILDQFDRDVAKKLDIELPNKPNGDQQYWLSEMKNANATTFDQIYRRPASCRAREDLPGHRHDPVQHA